MDFRPAVCGCVYAEHVIVCRERDREINIVNQREREQRERVCLMKVRLSPQRNEPYPSNRKDHDSVPEIWGVSGVFFLHLCAVCYRLNFLRCCSTSSIIYNPVFLLG